MAHHEYSAWALVPEGVWPGKFFTVKEFAQRGPGWAEGHTPIAWDDEFIAALDRLRATVGPLEITSGYRSPEYNAKVSSTGRAGPHTTGKAADLKVPDGHLAYVVLQAAFHLGFAGIGIDQKGPGRFIHVDTLDTPPRPNVWTY